MNESLNVTPTVGCSYRLLKDVLAASGRSLLDGKLIGSGPISVSSMMPGSIFTVVNPSWPEEPDGKWMVEVMCGDTNYIICLTSGNFEHIENDI